MSSQPIVVEALACVLSDGIVTQIYGPCPVGVAPASATRGQLIRRPNHGELHSFQVNTDGANGGTLELWDVNGHDCGADVSSGTTITQAQLTSLIARGLAKLIYKGTFSGTTGSGPNPYAGVYRTFMRGLAARFYVTAPASAAGVIDINMVLGGQPWELVPFAGV